LQFQKKSKTIRFPVTVALALYTLWGFDIAFPFSLCLASPCCHQAG